MLNMLQTGQKALKCSLSESHTQIGRINNGQEALTRHPWYPKPKRVGTQPAISKNRSPPEKQLSTSINYSTYFLNDKLLFKLTVLKLTISFMHFYFLRSEFHSSNLIVSLFIPCL